MSGRRPPDHAPGWDVGPERRIDDGRTLARGLAWFSIVLGAAELLAPRRFTSFLGVDDHHARLVRALGVREIAHGVAILSQRTPTEAVASRVAGDALDLAVLAAAVRWDDPRRGRLAGAMAMVGGAMAVDIYCTRRLGTHAH